MDPATIPTTTIPVVTKTKFPLWAGLVIVFLLLIVLVLGVAIVVLILRAPQATITPTDTTVVVTTPPATTPTPSAAPAPTTPLGWKTYINEEIGISLKHPADWKVNVNGSTVQIGEIITIYRPEAKNQVMLVLDGTETDTDPLEMAPLTIDGEKYLFTAYRQGDGAPGTSPDCFYGGYVISYVTEIKNHLLSISSHEDLSCDDNGKQVITKTDPEDIQLARQIASTLTFSD